MLRFLMKSCPFLKLLKFSFSFITQSDQKLDYSWNIFFIILWESFMGIFTGNYVKYIVHILSFMVNGYLAISCISEFRQDVHFLYFHLDLLSTENAPFSLILWENVFCNFLSFWGSFYFSPSYFLNSETLSSKSVSISKNCVWNINETFNSMVAFYEIHAGLFLTILGNLRI